MDSENLKNPSFFIKSKVEAVLDIPACPVLYSSFCLCKESIIEARELRLSFLWLLLALILTSKDGVENAVKDPPLPIIPLNPFCLGSPKFKIYKLGIPPNIMSSKLDKCVYSSIIKTSLLGDNLFLSNFSNISFFFFIILSTSTFESPSKDSLNDLISFMTSWLNHFEYSSYPLNTSSDSIVLCNSLALSCFNA